MYGMMSMRPVPASWEEFQAYWERMCREVLEDNPASPSGAGAGRNRPFAAFVPDAVFASATTAGGAAAALVHRRALRPAGPGFAGVQLVTARRMVAPPVLRRRAHLVFLGAAASTQTPARPGWCPEARSTSSMFAIGWIAGLVIASAIVLALTSGASTRIRTAPHQPA